MTYKDDIIAELRAVVDDLKEQNRAQANRIAELELQLAKALKNSSNSSKSPSSDIVKPPKKKADGRKKAKRGGQKGHPRMLREPLPPERVNEEFTYEIDAADVRELGLTAPKALVASLVSAITNACGPRLPLVTNRGVASSNSCMHRLLPNSRA